MSRFLIALVLLCSVVASAEPMKLPGYLWDSPVKWGVLQEAAPDAYFASYPADADAEAAQLDFLVVHTPRESAVTMKENGADPQAVVLADFLGITGRPEQINKALFLGGTEARRVWTSSIPRPNTVHVFQKYLEDGTLVTVGVRDYGTVKPPSVVGDVLTGISNSFKVDR